MDSTDSRNIQASPTPELSLFLPVLDEEENLREMHEKIASALDQLGKTAEVIFVDDGSTDKSLAILKEIAAKDDRVRVISLRRNYGQTAAMSAGIDAARGEILIPMDADLQNDPADIAQAVRKIGRGLRRRFGLAKEPPGQTDLAQDTIADREQDHLVDRRRAPARLRLLAKGISPRSDTGRPALRRDASLYPDLCELGRCTRDRNSGRPSCTDTRQIEIRHLADDQGRL